MRGLGFRGPPSGSGPHHDFAASDRSPDFDRHYESPDLNRDISAN